MSNTGFKGITDMEPNGEPYYRVAVMWRNESLTSYVPKTSRSALRLAIGVRTSFEIQLNKPSTEKIIRSSGVFHRQIGKSEKIRVVEWERE